MLFSHPFLNLPRVHFPSSTPNTILHAVFVYPKCIMFSSLNEKYKLGRNVSLYNYRHRLVISSLASALCPQTQYTLRCLIRMRGKHISYGSTAQIGPWPPPLRFLITRN
jgi:hypothetical protein